jgi:hypothetical protein
MNGKITLVKPKILPEIYSIFPKAKLIHIYRYGPSVIESFLLKEWPKYETYFKDKEEYLHLCANCWNDSIIEIENQKNLLHLNKSNYFDFSYERLCADPNPIIKLLSDFLEISLLKFDFDFDFDFSTIKSTNYKIGDYSKDEKKGKLLEIMTPTLKLKGYL